MFGRIFFSACKICRILHYSNLPVAHSLLLVCFVAYFSLLVFSGAYSFFHTYQNLPRYNMAVSSREGSWVTKNPSDHGKSASWAVVGNCLYYTTGKGITCFFVLFAEQLSSSGRKLQMLFCDNAHAFWERWKKCV